MFGRDQELAEIMRRVQTGRPFLLYGWAGVGKTLLMQEVLGRLPADSHMYCSPVKNLTSFVKSLCMDLAQREDRVVIKMLKMPHGFRAGDLEAAIKSSSSVGLQGLVIEALRVVPRVLILDHVEFVSQQFYGYIRELCRRCGVCIVVLATSYHMEVIGFLSAMFSDRRDRYHLKPFDPERSAYFARMTAETTGLIADNREPFLEKVVRDSRGNPAAIQTMIRMACDQRYRSGNDVRANLLYVDYCMRYSPPAVHD